jgi:hypothetical protein
MQKQNRNTIWIATFFEIDAMRGLFQPACLKGHNRIEQINVLNKRVCHHLMLIVIAM